MKNDMFTEACVLAQEQWVPAFLKTEEEHKFSRQFNQRMNRLYSKMRGGHYHRLTKTSLSILVAAVLIATLMVASIAYAPTRRYLIEVFDDHTKFKTEDSGLTSIPMDIHFGFIPEGFELVEREIDGETCELDIEGKTGMVSDYHFETVDGRWIDASKHPAGGWMGVDSETHPIETLKHDGVIYYISHSEDEFNGIHWMTGGVQYDIGGKLSREDIIGMAYHMR